MARMRKSRTGKGKKYEWMENHISLEFTATASSSPYSDSAYIDIAQCLSVLNRKLVRQGQLFRVRNFKVYTDETSNTQMRFKVGVLPTNWVLRNSWVKSRALWNELNAMVSEASGQSIYPKWHDYKVYMNEAHKDHVASDADSNLTPVDMDGTALEVGEWIYSKFSDSGSTSDNYNVHMLGPHSGSTGSWDSVGVIYAYQQSRVKISSPDPDIPTDIALSPWFRLFGDDDQTQDQVGNLESDNDAPPYSLTTYVGAGATMDGGMPVGVGRIPGIAQTQAGIQTVLPSFHAPCGLVRLEIDDTAAFADDKVYIQFDVDILGPMDM